MFQISSMMAHKILRVCTCTIFSAILESLRLLSFGYFSWDYCLTLLIQAFRRPKKGPLLIYPSRPLKDSKEPKTKQENNSIWRIPGHVMDIFFYWLFHIASKEYFSNFIYGFKSVILKSWKLPEWWFSVGSLDYNGA